VKVFIDSNIPMHAAGRPHAYRKPTDRARTLLLEVASISARDAVHAAVMRNHGIERIASYDDGFDDVAGIERLPLE